MISGQQLITMQSEYLLLYSLSQWKCFKSFIGFVYLHKSSEILYHIWASFESQINVFGLVGHSVYFVKQKIVAPSSNIRAFTSHIMPEQWHFSVLWARHKCCLLSLFPRGSRGRYLAQERAYCWPPEGQVVLILLCSSRPVNLTPFTLLNMPLAQCNF